jgi:trimeric autotransporter adhesin
MKVLAFAAAGVAGLGLLVAIASGATGENPRRVAAVPAKPAYPSVARQWAAQVRREVESACTDYAGTPAPQYFVGIKAGGADNFAGGRDSAVLGGQGNAACSVESAVGAGGANTIEVPSGGGDGYSFIASGVANVISASASTAFIGAGTYNGASAAGSFVGAGYQNSASGAYSFVGGGDENVAGAASFVGAGEYDRAPGSYSFVGSGSNNTASGLQSFAGDGDENSAAGVNSFVGAGKANMVSGAGSFIGGGGNTSSGNTITGADSFVGAGDQNSVSGSEAFIGSGGINTIGSAASYATILGGNRNNVSGEYASILGGFGNVANGSYAIVAGGDGDTAGGTLSFAAGYHVYVSHNGTFAWSDYSSGSSSLKDTAANQFLVRASGGTSIYSNETMTSGVTLPAGAGTWSSLSDRNAKTGIVPLDDASVLAKVASLPVSTWSYKSESGVRHAGPMAQDFYAAFGVGEDDRHLTSIDEDGIALAAIKALHGENIALNRRNDALQTTLLRVQTNERRKDAEIGLLGEKVRRLDASVAKILASR